MIMERLDARNVVGDPPVVTGMYLVCTCCNANLMRWWGTERNAVMFCPYCDVLQMMTWSYYD